MADQEPAGNQELAGVQESHPDPVADCLTQLDRTSRWLRSIPLTRLTRNSGELRLAVVALINAVHQLVIQLCPIDGVECPPCDSVPDTLADHALGDQLAVHTADLVRILPAVQSPPQRELIQISQAARAMRVSGSNPLMP
jgi:hypothetical protein